MTKHKNAFFILCVLLTTACSGTPESREAAHMKKGKAWLAKQDPKRAIIEFKVASQNMPKHAEPLFQLGMAYLRTREFPLAYEALLKATEVEPGHEAAHYQLAMFQVGSDNPQNVQVARAVVKSHLTAQPGDAEAMGALALAEAKLGNKDEALRQLEGAIAKDPSKTDRAAVILAYFAARGDDAMSRRITHALTARVPGSPEVALLRADVALATGDTADADSEIARSLSLRRNYVPALQLRLRRQMMAADAGAAEQTARLLAASSERKMWPAFAKLLFAENKIDAAMVEFDRVLQVHDGGPDTRNDDMRNDYSGLLLNAGRPREAVRVLDVTLEKNPKDKIALLQRAAALVDLGNPDAAGKDIRELLAAKAFSPALSYQQARMFAARGDVTRQGQLLNEALKADPDFLPARLDLAAMMVSAGNPAGAIDVLDKTNRSSRNTMQYLFARNSALIASGDYAAARKGVDAGLSGVHTSGMLYQDALLRTRTKDLAGAKRSLMEAFSAAHSDREIVDLLGRVMADLGESSKFVALLRDALAKDQNSPGLQTALGGALAAQGDAAGALASYQAAAAAGDKTANVELATLDAQAGNFDSAIRHMQEAVKASDNARLQVLLANLETRRGGAPDMITQHYLRALQLDPANVVAMNNLANLLASRPNKLDDARFWAEKALSLQPSNPALADTVGWIYFRQAKYDAARTFLERSLKAQDRPLAHYHLAAALAGAGDRNRAREEYQLAVAQDPRSEARTTIAALFEGR